MEKILLLISCLVFGYFLKRHKIVSENAHIILNSLIIYICVPSVTIRYGFEIDFNLEQLLPAVSAWIVFLGSWIFFTFSRKILHFDRNTTGALIVTAGISSISFIGFPIFEIMYGEEGLKYGIILSQAGTFIVCSTIGIFIASIYADDKKKLHWADLLKSNLTFPPFIAFCLVILLKSFNLQLNTLMLQFFETLGSPLSIFALISIGMQISFTEINANKIALFFGLFYKLLVAPILVYVIFFLCFKTTGVAAKVSVVGSAIGCMNTIGIIAIKKGLNPPLVSVLLAFSIPLSLFLLPMIYFLLEYFYE